ncbi:MAG: DUF4254 domain-containing protein [Bradymonadales bacterium]|nr:DUF4254 domain-containing protein [Bradymonadales bacterium]
MALRKALGQSVSERLVLVGLDLGLLDRLFDTHRSLWALEDQARSRTASNAEIARIKRGIDALNAARHRLIDQLDLALHPPRPSEQGTGGEHLSPTHCTAGFHPPRSAGQGSRRYSETIAELCDRILIQTLKIDSLAVLARDPALPVGERERCLQKRNGLVAWRKHLRRCLLEQVEDLLEGRATLPPRTEFKLYNEPWLNPATRPEKVE